MNIPDDPEAFWALFADELSKPLPPIPLHETPIYAQMKIEEMDQALARVKNTITVATDAMAQLGQGARAAFISFDELTSVTSRAITEHHATMQAHINAMHAVPDHSIPIQRKPLLKNRKRR